MTRTRIFSMVLAPAILGLLVLSCETGDGQEVQSVQTTPITFVVRNLSGTALYIDWATGGENLVRSSMYEEDQWETIYLWQPYCMDSCESCDPLGCTMRCSLQARTKIFEDGAEETRTWSGERILVLGQYNSSSCTEPASVKAGRYRVSACAYDGFLCLSGDCAADADGVMTDAATDGDPRCGEFEFDLPFEGAEIVLEIR